MKAKVFFLSIVAAAVAGQITAQEAPEAASGEVLAAPVADSVGVEAPVEVVPVADTLPVIDSLIVVEMTYDGEVVEEIVVEEEAVGEMAGDQQIDAVVVSTHPQSVRIAGVDWATCNVGEAGEFVADPKEHGRYFSFTEARTACPEGWRLPTAAEFKSLCEAGSEWTVEGRRKKDRRYGRRFGEGQEAMTVPAAGYMDSRGKVENRFPGGFYWSADKTNGNVTNQARGRYLRLHKKQALTTNNHAYDGKFSVRCVREE